MSLTISKKNIIDLLKVALLTLVNVPIIVYLAIRSLGPLYTVFALDLCPPQTGGLHPFSETIINGCRDSMNAQDIIVLILFFVSFLFFLITYISALRGKKRALYANITVMFALIIYVGISILNSYVTEIR